MNILFPFLVGAYYLTYLAVIKQSVAGMVAALLLAIGLSIVMVLIVRKLILNQPNFTITNSYIKLDPQTRKEITIEYDQIRTIEVLETYFQRSIGIVVYNEEAFTDQLSLYNKIKLGPNKWFGYQTVTISHKALAKRDRLDLVNTLDHIVENRMTQDFTVTDVSHQPFDSEKEFMETYDPHPIKDFEINQSYFKEAYGYSFFIFLLVFVLFYVLIGSGDGYLVYIIFSFVAFPFAKVFLDRIGMHKLRQKIDKQKGPTIYIDQMKFVFEALLFHLSMFVAPFGLLLVFIRYMIKKRKE